MSAVQGEERVVIRHVGKVMHRGVEIDRLVHVAAEAVFRVVDAAERKQQECPASDVMDDLLLLQFHEYNEKQRADQSPAEGNERGRHFLQ